MKICGIVAEYNPFHNGHKYQINKVKEEFGADGIVAVMSGNFIQRGLPALFDKWTRAKMALQNGVDLVIELPTYYAVSSAEYFATGAISILNSLGVINDMCFGASTTDIDTLKRISNVLFLEPEGFKKLLRSDLKRGASFPIARSNALKNFLKKEYDAKYIADILLDPNNILAIEYLKALQYLNSEINPVAIKRKGTDYNSLEIVDNICSATAIREKLMKSEVGSLDSVMPDSCYSIIESEIINGKAPMYLKNFEKEILYSFRRATSDEISSISDVTEGLENTIKKCSNEKFTLDEFIEEVKSKRYTRTRIQRIMLSMLLNIKKEDIEGYKHNLQYIRVLGFNKNGEKILSKIYNNCKISVVTNVPKFMKTANNSQLKMIEKDILATNIYTLGYQVPNYRKSNLDYTMPIIKE